MEGISANGDVRLTLSTTEPSPFSSVVTAVDVYDIDRVNKFRRYGGSLTTRSRVNGEIESGVKGILYRVGRRSTEGHIDMELPSFVNPGYAQVIEVNETLYQEVDTKLRSYVNASPDFSKADLSGVIARLAASLALYSMSGTLDMSQIRGSGVSIRLRAITAASRALPATGVVYIPNHTALVDCPAAFSALVCAVNGAGAAAVSDYVVVNPETNAARITFAKDHDLAYGCVVGLRMLLSQYEVSGYGAVAGLALTKGVHSVMSVAGHSDEGGYIRDVLRRNTFAVPYGCIFTSKLNSFTHFPSFARNSRIGAITLMDGIALKTAAAVSICDPLVYLGGRAYPTIFTAGKLEETGADSGETDAVVNRRLRSDVALGCGRFCRNYVEELGRLATGNTGGVEIAAPFLKMMFNSAAEGNLVNRHISGGSIAPFTWIEPTSLYEKVTETAANKEGYGVLTGTNESTSKEAYPSAEVIFQGTTHIGVSCEMRSIRTVPGLLHMYMHPQDGLANVVPYRMVPDLVAMMGSGHDPANPAGGTVRDNMIATRGMDAYAWRHGSSHIPSPAECMYIGQRVGLRLKVMDVDFDTFSYNACHTVCPADSLGTTYVTMTASKPSSLGIGMGMGEPTLLRRARTRAEAALAALNNRMTGVISSMPADLTMQFCEPGAFDTVSATGGYIETAEIQGAGPALLVPVDDASGPPRKLVYIDQPARVMGARRAPGGDPGPRGGGGLEYEEDLGEGAPPAEEEVAGGEQGHTIEVTNNPIAPGMAQEGGVQPQE